MNCPTCNSSRIRKNGIRGDNQRLLCSQCGKSFTAKKGSKKRILVLSDTHCGHLWGLTPPQYFTMYDEKAYSFQKEAWTWFTNMLNLYKPFDICIANGDLIDGRGDKSGSTELISADRMKQASMAAEILFLVNAETTLIARGTDYHVGKSEQFENRIADLIDAQEIEDKLRFRVNGSLFDIRHHVSGSTIPWSEFTGSLKELVLANIEKGENINVMIRSHVHKYTYGSIGPNQMVITTPGLQGHSRFGTKRCVGRVDFGVVILDVDAHGEVKAIPVIADLESLKHEISEY